MALEPESQAGGARARVVSPGDVRRAGLLAAIGLGLLIMLGLTVTMIVRRSRPVAVAPVPVRVVEDVGGVGAVGGVGGAAAGTSERAPAPSGPEEGFSAGRSRIAFLDQSDPGRTSAVMSWQDLRPTGQGNSLVTEPRGLMFLRDGGVALVTAARGTFFTPQGKTEPEAGRFEGGVTMELFDAVPGRAVDLVADSPSVVATAQTLLFEATESTVSTPDRFVAESASFAVEGVGSRVVFDQVAQGIARAEFNKVDRVRVWPGGRPGIGGSAVQSLAQESRRAKAGPRPAASTAKAATSTGASVGVSAAAPARRVYRAVVEDDVQIRQGSRAGGGSASGGGTSGEGARVSLSASRAEVWLTTENNRLVEGAIAPLEAGLLPVELAGAAPGGASGGIGAAADADAGGAGAAGAAAEPIVATWSGRMVITPVTGVPESFGPSLAAIRLTGGAAGPARVVDRGGPGGEAVALAAPVVEYAATTRVLELTGTRASNVVLDAPRVGLLTCTRAKLDASSGRFEVIGPGELTALTEQVGAGEVGGGGGRDKDEGSLLVSWSEGLTLKAEASGGARGGASGGASGGDGRVGRSLRLIEARGSVRAQTGALVATAESAKLRLAEPASMEGGGGAKRGPRVEEVELAGNASASTRRQTGAGAGGAVDAGGADGVGGEVDDRLSGDLLRVMLERDAQGRDVPLRVEVTGRGVAIGSGLQVTAPRIVAELSAARSTDGRVAVTGARAEGPGGQAMVTGAGGLQAFADVIEADPVAQTARLTGAPARVLREGAELAASSVLLSQRDEVVTIDAPGTLSAVAQQDADGGGGGGGGSGGGAGGGSRPVRVSASWGGSARMDNKAGVIEARGGTQVNIAVGDEERNTIKGDRLELALMPGAAGSSERRVRSVRVLAAEGQSGGGASVEHRRFAVGVDGGGAGSGGALTRVVYLQGAEVRADAVSGLLEVPGAGKLLVDQAGEPAQAGVATASAPGGSPLALLAGGSVAQGRGTSLFAWEGSLRMDRASGRLELRRGVQLTHRPSDAQSRLTLDCDELDADLTPRSGAGGGGGGGGGEALGGLSADLRRVEARGAVRAGELAGAGAGGEVAAGRELTALRVVFDAANGVLSAAGSDETPATFVDAAHSGPIRARALEWDLRGGRLSAEGMAPITIAPMR